MAERRRAERSDWPKLVVTLGLAATITSLFGLATETIRARHEEHRQQCELAAQLLQDDRPTPYLADQAGRRMTALAYRRLTDCLRGG